MYLSVPVEKSLSPVVELAGVAAAATACVWRICNLHPSLFVAWRLLWATSIAIIHLCQTYVLVVRACANACMFGAYLLVPWRPLLAKRQALVLAPRLDCGRIGGRTCGEEVVFGGRVVHI